MTKVHSTANNFNYIEHFSLDDRAMFFDTLDAHILLIW